MAYLQWLLWCVATTNQPDTPLLFNPLNTSFSYTSTEAREVLNNQQDILLENVIDQVNGYFDSIQTGSDPQSRIEVGHLLPLGVFVDDRRRLASESLTKYRLSDQTNDDSYLVAGATNVLHVGKRIVFAYVYTIYNNETDREWVRQMSDKWSADILTMNPQSPQLIALAQKIDWNRVGKVALIGAIVGAILGAVIVIRRRRRG